MKEASEEFREKTRMNSRGMPKTILEDLQNSLKQFSKNFLKSQFLVESEIYRKISGKFSNELLKKSLDKFPEEFVEKT